MNLSKPNAEEHSPNASASDTLATILESLETTRISLNGSRCRTERSRIGQFFTPVTIARFMASLFRRQPDHARILDAGAGTGVLLAASVERLTSKARHPTSVEVIAYENDERILPDLRKTLKGCESACNAMGITFSGEVRAEDFIASGIARMPSERFTHAILNPPYKKIRSQTQTRRSLDAAGIGVSNSYAAFVWLAVRMLEVGGELAAITPRSFCNGPYFRRFRVELLESVSLRRVHVFESRDEAFKDDHVLQENVIYYGVRGEDRPKSTMLSSSTGADFKHVIRRSVAYERVVLPEDDDAFIHLALNEGDESVLQKSRCFSSFLSDIGLDVSTGPVVDFRARNYLCHTPHDGAMPLVYPSHFQSGYVNWPGRSTKKPNAILVSPWTSGLLLPAGYYVLTRRFSAKEEPRRVVAAVYDPGRIDAMLVGFENHLNYFHANGKGLPRNLANGLALYLNSSLFDRLFRLFSGHTQVNATDLRKIRYPSRKQLLRLGRLVRSSLPSQDMIDFIVEKECVRNAEGNQHDQG